MAASDYYLCDVCGEKCFYDANLNYNYSTSDGDELAALKSAPVVMPERKKLPELMMATYHEYRGWNACLDKFERMNRSSPNE